MLMSGQPKMLTPAQCRAARALLDWSQPELAKAAGIGLSTVVDFERSRRVVATESVDAIRSAIEAAGVRLIDGGATLPTEAQPVADVDYLRRADEAMTAWMTAESAITRALLKRVKAQVKRDYGADQPWLFTAVLEYDSAATVLREAEARAARAAKAAAPATLPRDAE
jgi:transcriptional regulator with XRE-family HTH domain